ncbi:hypothetical protein V6N13_015890 [Hibiscus sabdariffa]|uniref:Uncharacterized protein n=1 Tax=Hibiscus sabdariffa TaxID=183260 RepID=A0ABR2CXI9_9ROSI
MDKLFETLNWARFFKELKSDIDPERLFQQRARSEGSCPVNELRRRLTVQLSEVTENANEYLAGESNTSVGEEEEENVGEIMK